MTPEQLLEKFEKCADHGDVEYMPFEGARFTLNESTEEFTNVYFVHVYYKPLKVWGLHVLEGSTQQVDFSEGDTVYKIATERINE